jgi:5-methylcytosine-specific restriction endonuclease McrA
MRPRIRPAKFRTKPTSVGPKTVAKIRRTKTEAYTHDWDAISKAIIRRDGGCCTHCRSTKRLNVHHIVPIAKGGRTVGFNLITLCSSCHSAKHSHMH